MELYRHATIRLHVVVIRHRDNSYNTIYFKFQSMSAKLIKHWSRHSKYLQYEFVRW